MGSEGLEARVGRYRGTICEGMYSIPVRGQGQGQKVRDGGVVARA